MMLAAEQREDVALLHNASRIHDANPVRHVGNDTHVVRDQEEPGAGFLAQSLDQRQNLRLDGDVESGGRLVGNQQARAADQRDGDHDPLTGPTGQLERILPHPPFRVCDADLFEHGEHRCGGGAAAGAAMGDQRFSDLPADRHQRVERGGRFLEDHRHHVTADRRHPGLVEPRDVASLELDRAGAPVRDRRQQAHDGARRQALAAAALAHQCQRLAATDRKAQPIDDRRIPDRDAEILDAQQRIVRAHPGCFLS